jgi:hypothetical protein
MLRIEPSAMTVRTNRSPQVLRMVSNVSKCWQPEFDPLNRDKRKRLFKFLLVELVKTWP